MTEFEDSDGAIRKREVKVSPPKSPVGALGALFGRWIPGRGGGEKVEVMGGVGKDHAE